ncbi:hypothetical protein HJ059_11415 [Vibrio parahaemolyticus]|uniref:hypothetical protein n=1 Tax=Vibrio parahaemolyticus TaxID=670 RepID=UPI0003FB5E16|nr:hypothetical protein [Vibrio parahaemolyticus]MBE4011368.1 hypothetical protein [Vibrio parahaemolyticus]MBE4348181.1 hypothetical protein [Vibrio parahaemolyticus]HCG5535548.1 hypothetical protein [Vibrio parahaemolyticus]
MKSLLNRTPENKYANIVYAGVGKGENLAALKLWTEGNIITIDPNTQTSELMKRYHPEVKHYAFALSIEDGEHDFYEYWPESLSTLRDAVTLPNELKNAQLKCTRVVKTRSLNAIMSECDLYGDYNLFILSANGVELEIVNSLSNNELDSFSCLIIEADHKNIYHQSIEYAEELKSSLVSLGYYLFDIERDTIYSSFIFFRDEDKKALELESGKLKAEHAKVREERDEAKDKESELTSRLSHLESSHSSLETRISELTTENAKLIESNKALAIEIQGERDKGQEEQELAQSLTQQLAQFNQQSEAKKSELTSRLSQLESENQELTRSTRLNQKMLVKSQVDLDDLREKYAAKLQSETELVELIKELREKLTIASQYYYQLQQEHPELLTYLSSSKDE